MQPDPMVGEAVLELNAPTSEWTVAAKLDDITYVLRYETAASEPNWYGTEGYVLVNWEAETSRFEDPNGDVYILKSDYSEE